MMATERERNLMVAAILRSRMHCPKNASVAVGVLYALGQFTLAAKFAHDYECVGPAGQFAEMHGEDGLTATRRRRALAATQALIDRVVDQIESASPERGRHA
jgi:hypothetical protein